MNITAFILHSFLAFANLEQNILDYNLSKINLPKFSDTMISYSLEARQGGNRGGSSASRSGGSKRSSAGVSRGGSSRNNSVSSGRSSRSVNSNSRNDNYSSKSSSRERGSSIFRRGSNNRVRDNVATTSSSSSSSNDVRRSVYYSPIFMRSSPRPIVPFSFRIGVSRADEDSESTLKEIKIESFGDMIDSLQKYQEICESEVNTLNNEFLDVVKPYMNQTVAKCVKEENIKLISLAYSKATGSDLEKSEYYNFIDVHYDKLVANGVRLDKDEKANSVKFEKNFWKELEGLLEKIFK